MHPVAWTLAATASIWVLASARRRGFPLYAAAVWTLGTLFFPPIVLPLYLIARARATRTAPPVESLDPRKGGAAEQPSSALGAPPAWNRWLTTLYAVVVLSFIALYLYGDYRSVDSHLARANQARVMGQRERTIREYRAALRLEDDPHTHNLLGIELADAGLWEESLAELRAAERGGEPDDQLSLRIATALDAMKRPAEASLEYQRFLGGGRCTQALPDPRCETARGRVQTMSTGITR